LSLSPGVEKERRKSGVSMSLSVALDEGDRVRTTYRIGGLFVK